MTVCLVIYDFIAFLDSCSHAQILTRCLWSLSRSFRSCLHARIWREILLLISIRTCSDSDEMSCSDVISRSLWSFSHARIVLDVRWIISLLIKSHMLWDALIKVLDQMRFTSKCSIRCVSHRWFDRRTVLHERRSLYMIWFDLQYFRIDFKMRFTSSVRSENCSARTKFSL